MPEPILILALQVVVAVGLLNVWLLRSRMVTSYRGGDARTLREEFATYGLPFWFFAVIGVLKVGAAVALLAALWLPALILPAAAIVFALMLGALAMHAKVKDPPAKSVPAFLMLVMSLGLLVMG